MSDVIFSESVPSLVAFLTDKIRAPEDKKKLWAAIKRDHNDFLCEVLGVDPEWGLKAGNLIGFDIDFDRQLILLNYSPSAHNLLHEIEGGWTPVLKQLRGLVVSYEKPGHLRGIKLASRGFEKFFNYWELPETSQEELSKFTMDRPVFCTRKEDGHMIEYFLHRGQLSATTRGRLETPSGLASLDMLTRSQFIKAHSIASLMSCDLMSLVCEFVHPTTEVHVDYEGVKKIYLLEAYDTRGKAVDYAVLARIASEMPGIFKMPEARWMTVDELHAEINDRSVENCEGWVSQVPDRHGPRRIKYKYISYIGRMVKSKLSYKYLMNCIKNDRLDMMLITLPEELRATAYDMVDQVRKLAATGEGPFGYRVLYDLHTEAEGGRENFRNICRGFYRSQNVAG
tara:strand:+ start:2477 stop:3667 length:1191 start_codon:yes stop_codon:yes gene_type:complete